jgi:hypothetical protein
VAKQQFFGMFILLMEHMVVSLQEWDMLIRRY